MTPQLKWTQVMEGVFADHPDGGCAKSFLVAFHGYCHYIDDLVDEGVKSNEDLLKSYALALDLYSSTFYLKYVDRLYPVIRTIHHTYADSVIMERSVEDWKKKQAGVLAGAALEMTLTIAELLRGYEVRRSISILVREDNYLKHYDPETGLRL